MWYKVIVPLLVSGTKWLGEQFMALKCHALARLIRDSGLFDGTCTAEKPVWSLCLDKCIIESDK